MSHLYNSSPQTFHCINGALQLQIPPQLRPFTVSFFCEEESPSPRSAPWGAFRSQGCHIMVTQLAWWSYLECTYSSTLHHCQVPILHLGDVRHAWSSHLAHRCYIANWRHWDSNRYFSEFHAFFMDKYTIENLTGLFLYDILSVNTYFLSVFIPSFE